VGDRGLERLKGLSQLRTLGVRATNVHEAGIKELQQALPKLTIQK
jgi:hypothetical protein